MPLDLTDDEIRELTALLQRTIAGDRYPLSTRVKTLREILAKIEPPDEQPEPLPPPVVHDPSWAMQKKRRNRWR